MADLEANMMHFQLMHESLARFSESFASFMYGLNMNAYCVDFPEVRPRETHVLVCGGARKHAYVLLTSSLDCRAPFLNRLGERDRGRRHRKKNARQQAQLEVSDETQWYARTVYSSTESDVC